MCLLNIILKLFVKLFLYITFVKLLFFLIKRYRDLEYLLDSMFKIMNFNCFMVNQILLRRYPRMVLRAIPRSWGSVSNVANAVEHATRLAVWSFLSQLLRNPALFQLVWPKKFRLPFFDLVLSWLALNIRLVFVLHKFPLLKHIYYSILSATYLQIFCDKCCITPTPAFWCW